jgi:hypothetical protein
MSNSAKKDECQPYRFFIKDQLKNYMKPETDSKLQNNLNFSKIDPEITSVNLCCGFI